MPELHKIIAQTLHNIADSVACLDVGSAKESKEADHYADLAAEASHRLETLQSELGREIESFKTSTALPMRHLTALTQMLERSKISEPPSSPDGREKTEGEAHGW